MSLIQLPMYIRRILFALLGVILSTYVLVGQDRNMIKNVHRDALDQSLLEIIDDHTEPFADSTQLAIALLKREQIHYIGVMKIDGALTLVDNKDKVFEIGSISKVFTSTILGQMVDQEIVSLDDRAGQLLGLNDLDDYGVTLQHLSNHTSGLFPLPANLNGTTSNPYKDYDSQLLMEYLSSEVELSTLPGEAYAYSNLGAGLLGYILTEQMGQSYEELLQERICTPLGLNHTSSIRANIAQDQIVSGRHFNGEIAANWDFDVLVGAGGILSTVEDLIQFAQSQIDGSLTSSDITHNTTHNINENMEMGLGWHIINPESGGRWLWHNGGTGGYTSSLTIDKDHETSVVILSNVSGFHSSMSSIEQLSFALIKELNK
jgi:CubicO group peptidase (beta-lactamase class C family)